MINHDLIYSHVLNNEVSCSLYINTCECTYMIISNVVSQSVNKIINDILNITFNI